MRNRGKSKSEKVAEQLAQIVNDFDLDLDQVGVYLARLKPSLFYNRLNVIVEAAEYEMEMNSVRATHEPLF